jgi:hypothetical protein
VLPGQERLRRLDENLGVAVKVETLKNKLWKPFFHFIGSPRVVSWRLFGPVCQRRSEGQTRAIDPSIDTRVLITLLTKPGAVKL